MTTCRLLKFYNVKSEEIKNLRRCGLWIRLNRPHSIHGYSMRLEEDNIMMNVLKFIDANWGNKQ